MRYISLVNLIAGKAVVPEMIQGNSTPKRIKQALDRILQDRPYRNTMLDGYQAVMGQLSYEDTFSQMAKKIREILESGSSELAQS